MGSRALVKQTRKTKMKKLMFMLAAAVAVVGAQAAQVSWSINVAGKGSAWAGNGAYAMAFNGSDYDTVIKLLTVTGSDNMATAIGGYALSLDVGGTSTSILEKRSNAVTTGISTGVTSDKSMFWVIFTDGSMDASKAITWTAVTDVASYAYEAGTSLPGTVSLNADSFAKSGTIATASVPEPTSAMLLVLGMAGLALRRKCA